MIFIMVAHFDHHNGLLDHVGHFSLNELQQSGHTPLSCCLWVRREIRIREEEEEEECLPPP